MDSHWAAGGLKDVLTADGSSCAQTYNKVVFIKQPITDDVANNMIALTLHLDSIDQKRIYYWLNVAGGEVRMG